MIIALALTIACIATGGFALVIAGRAILADVSPRVANVDVVVGGDKFEICGLVLLYAIVPFGAKRDSSWTYGFFETVPDIYRMLSRDWRC